MKIVVYSLIVTNRLVGTYTTITVRCLANVYTLLGMFPWAFLSSARHLLSVALRLLYKLLLVGHKCALRSRVYRVFRCFVLYPLCSFESLCRNSKTAGVSLAVRCTHCSVIWPCLGWHLEVIIYVTSGICFICACTIY